MLFSLSFATAAQQPDMGPKNSAAMCAIVPSKDLSWIDRMYLKLENMCVEVDKNPSILLQETSKYMESHMNVVGANVKKLCTELIQDLISPPILSSEGVEKVPECAIHCKCNCMDFEKPKQKGIGTVTKGSNPKAGHGVIPAKGFEVGDKITENINCEMQDMKIESRQEESATQAQDFNVEGSTPKSEVSSKELTIIPETHNGEELNTAGGQEELKTLVEAHETGSNSELEEQLSLPKGSPGLDGEDQNDSTKAYNKSSKPDESRMIGEENCIKAIVCRGEIDLAEQASRSKENDCQELDIVDGKIAVHRTMVAQSSVIARDLRVQEVKVQQHADDVLYGTHARPKSISKVSREWHASHAKVQNSLDSKIALQMKMDTKDSNGKYMEREEVQETNGVGGDLQAMYSYVFSELSSSNKEEDPMIMSDFLIEDDYKDEEQSARWFDGEDVSKALHTDNFCIENLGQAEGCVKEYDSDWELV